MTNTADDTGAESEPRSGKPRHHLMIAGTGRAGTSFLVRFLAAMGLETHLAKSSDAQWNDEANAGLEDIPLTAAFDNLPYVIKTPFLSEIIDDVLHDPAVVIDTVIIPVRSLVEAAASRTVVELQAIHQLQPWMAGLDHMVETWGVTPGGTVYSLNPMDQGRLLAVGLHRLIECLTRADVPMLFLDFPRLAEDPDYLFTKLRSLLPADSAIAQAQTAHARLADAAKIRIGTELRTALPDESESMSRGGLVYPAPDTLDLIAIRRELVRLRATHGGGSNTQREQQLGQRELAMGQRETAMAQREHNLTQRADELARQAEILVRDTQELAERDADRGKEIAEWRARAEASIAERDSILSSLSWRITRPLRIVTPLAGNNRPKE